MSELRCRCELCGFSGSYDEVFDHMADNYLDDLIEEHMEKKILR